MKLPRPFILLLALTLAGLGLSTSGCMMAVRSARRAMRDRDSSGDGDQSRSRERGPTRTALFRALDTNHDGVLDATEIAHAPAELRKLDDNGDGRITPDELENR